MHYLSVAQARVTPGLRLVLTQGFPNPWGEAAKALFALRAVPFAAVAQIPAGANAELIDWTGARNAPVAVVDGEPPVTGWLDMVLLAERLGSGPSLLPDDPLDRALAIGLSHEICGRDGFGWCRRIILSAPALKAAQGAAAMPDDRLTMWKAYGVSLAALEGATARAIAILTALTRQLERQRDRGSPYLVGDRLSACDIHWACFSNMIAPLPDAACPMPDTLRQRYGDVDAALAAALAPLLLAHRDRIFARHIALPLDF